MNKISHIGSIALLFLKVQILAISFHSIKYGLILEHYIDGSLIYVTVIILKDQVLLSIMNPALLNCANCILMGYSVLAVFISYSYPTSSSTKSSLS